LILHLNYFLYQVYPYIIIIFQLNIYIGIIYIEH